MGINERKSMNSIKTPEEQETENTIQIQAIWKCIQGIRSDIDKIYNRIAWLVPLITANGTIKDLTELANEIAEIQRDAIFTDDLVTASTNSDDSGNEIR